MKTPLSARSSLEEVETLFNTKPRRAKELGQSRRGVIGYFCCQVPLELFTALDLVPYRIQGNVHEPITLADSYLEMDTCPYTRSCFDLALKGDYDFLDGLVVSNSCKAIRRMCDVWISTRRPRFHHFLNVPLASEEMSLELFKRALEGFGRGMEQWTGCTLTETSLKEAVRLHNENRALLRELYTLREPDPPLISGTQVAKVVLSGLGLPVQESSNLVRKVVLEVREQQQHITRRHARILIFGNEMDDVPLIQLIEASGGNVVMDCMCLGSRTFWIDVNESGDPWESLSRRYLYSVHCPRNYVPGSPANKDNLEASLGHIGEYVRRFRVNGVVMYVTRSCDIHRLSAPFVQKFLEGMGVPSVYVEHDYNMTTAGQLRTKLQAFLKTLE
ncbi:MAG: 2-hydroxyacyl-CoA dehydratase [Chloroflexi bacterium]|nr:2-hydroxyacyl-CoA dehydratase [Chloroflexota bacterium]